MKKNFTKSRHEGYIEYPPFWLRAVVCYDCC